MAIKEVDLQMNFVNFTVLRWLVASAGFLVVLAFLGGLGAKFERKDLPRLIFVAFFNVVAYHLALNYAEDTVSAGLAGLLISLGPVFSALLSVVFLKERMGGRLAGALLLAVTSALVLSFPVLGQGLGSASGPLAVVVSAFSYATFGVFSKPLVTKYGALVIAAWSGLIGTCMLLPLVSGTLLTQAEGLSIWGWTSLLYLSLISTVVGYSIFFTLLGRGVVSKLFIQLYLAPLVSVVGGVLLFHESISSFIVVGGAGLLVAVWLATNSSPRR